MKVNDLVSLGNQLSHVYSEGIEIFPGVGAQFLLENYENTGFRVFVNGVWPFTEVDASRGDVELGFAGKYELDINGVSQSEYFGNVEKNEFMSYKTNKHLHFTSSAVPFTITGEEKISVEVKWTIYMQQPVSVFQQYVQIPESLKSQETLSVVGKAMLADDSTADLILKCGAEIFRAHKVVLCSRAMIQGSMLEAREGEVTITDIDPGTFATMLYYVYTGELEEGEDLDINKMIYAAEKYDLVGLKDLLFLMIKSEDIQEEFIPDLLILADKYQASQMKKLALEKIRANRNILEDPEFQRRMINSPHILFALMKDL